MANLISPDHWNMWFTTLLDARANLNAAQTYNAQPEPERPTRCESVLDLNAYLTRLDAHREIEAERAKAVDSARHDLDQVTAAIIKHMPVGMWVRVNYQGASYGIGVEQFNRERLIRVERWDDDLPPLTHQQRKEQERDGE